MGDVQELFDLLSAHCTNRQLRDAVRIYRPVEKEYPLDGNADQLSRRLRALFNLGHLPRAALERILIRAEENGHQHILFYVPKHGTRQAFSDFPAVARRLLDGESPDEAGLPKFVARPDGVIFSDARTETVIGTDYSSWTIKLYSGAYHWRRASRETPDDDTRIDVYKRQYRRDVLLMKWHSFGLLELRIPTDAANSITSIKAQRTAMLALAAKASSVSGALEALDLRPAVREFSEAAERKEPWVKFNSPVYSRPGITWEAHSEEEGANSFESSEFKNAHKALGGAPTEGRVILRFKSDIRNQPDELTVELCTWFENEARIGAQTTPEAVDYFIRRLWERAGGAKLPSTPVDSIALDADVESDLGLIDFPAFAEQHPYVANALIRIAKWVKDHPSSEYLDARRIAKEVGGGLREADLYVAIGKLVDAGVLEQRYRIKPPKRRKYLEKTYSSLDEIAAAEEFVDATGEAFAIDDAEIKPVFGARTRA